MFAGATGGVLRGGTLALLRDLAGMTGTGLLSAAATAAVTILGARDSGRRPAPD